MTGEAEISLYAAQEKIYPRSILGYFAKWRWVMVWLTQLFFYGVPWLQWGDRQAMLFALEAKRFYIFNLVLYPQDLIYLTAILIISALSLFLFTSVAGRLWCGYTCPQTVYTEIFLWIEKKIEGDRAKRIKLDNSGFSFRKLTTKLTKHSIWILFALWTGFTFVGYFTPIRALFADVTTLQLGGWSLFWVLFYGFATYGNAGFMREQVCKYMCPYARFQSAMFDNDTLIVTYDEARGEPRSRAKKTSNVTKGDCIDCTLCVQVCPTGIDIRKGLQYECIGCGACADVCDTIMDKVGAEKGLIKYSTQNALRNDWSKVDIIKRIFRPRVLIYSALLWLLIGGMLFSLINRPDFRVNVIRDRGVMARLAPGGLLENVYRLQLMNQTETSQRLALSAQGLANLTLATNSYEKTRSDEKQISHDMNSSEKIPFITLPATESRWISVRLAVPDGQIESGTHAVSFQIKDIDTNAVQSEASMFLVPHN